jgi:hypothetical protein
MDYFKQGPLRNAVAAGILAGCLLLFSGWVGLTMATLIVLIWWRNKVERSKNG